jgi:hypothetical protein
MHLPSQTAGFNTRPFIFLVHADAIGAVILQDAVGLIGALVVATDGNKHLSLANLAFILAALGLRDPPVDESAGDAAGSSPGKEAGNGTGGNKGTQAGNHQRPGAGRQAGQAAEDAAGSNPGADIAGVNAHIEPAAGFIAAFTATLPAVLIAGQDGYFPVKTGSPQVFYCFPGYLLVAENGNYCLGHIHILLMANVNSILLWPFQRAVYGYNKRKGNQENFICHC